VKDCPGCNCENPHCPDFTAELKEVLAGLLEASRERADDWELGERGYYYWSDRAKELLNAK